MSWQSYVDEQVKMRKSCLIFIQSFLLDPLLTITNFQLLASQQVSSAAIAGLDGNIWAKSSGFNCSPDEVKRILGSWENKNGMGMNGVTVNGMK